MTEPIHPQCEGERCAICGRQATNKVAEEILYDKPPPVVGSPEYYWQPERHPLTAYVCEIHFRDLLGPPWGESERDPESPPNYPRGQISPDDKGELEIAITVKRGTVIMLFRKPVEWLGLGYSEARSLGEMLLKKAEEIKLP